MFSKTKQQYCFELYRSTNIHHSIEMPRKNEQNTSKFKVILNRNGKSQTGNIRGCLLTAAL